MATPIVFWPSRPGPEAALEGGFAAALNAAAREHPHTDLALVADACTLPDGWLERMLAAAHAHDTTAGASALVTGEGAPMFSGNDGDPVIVDGQPSITGRPHHPHLLVLRPQCSVIRGSALELVGPLDESLAHPAAVLAEFSARALSRGLSCVLADDVIVARRAGGLGPCPEAEHHAVARLHPWFASARGEEDALELGPLRGALIAARVADRPLSVTIDARSLGGTAAGTQVYASGLAIALARSRRVTVRAVIRDDAPSPVTAEFERAGVEVVTETRTAGGIARTDIAHRPQQVFVPEDLSLLRAVGERVVITHLDLISYRNPAYHDSADEWRRYRRLTRVALGAADRVVFLSDRARREAVSEDLIEPGFTAVAGVGIDPRAVGEPPRQPERLTSGRDLLVMLGSDYLHKNRLFALELVDELRRGHGWEGMLVLAGAHVANGGSAAAERGLLAANPALAAHVVDLGPVGEGEKRWLLEHGQALLCPSTYEGFGLTPLEAAAAGIPCVYAPITSLSEVAGEAGATIEPWDAGASAARVVALLQAGEPREHHLASLRGALGGHRWDSIAERLHGVYGDAIGSPYRSSVPRAWEELEREQVIAMLDRAYRDLRERVELGLPLIDRGGMLSREQQQGLMRIAARRWLRGPLLGPLGLLGGIGSDDRGPCPP